MVKRNRVNVTRTISFLVVLVLISACGVSTNSMTRPRIRLVRATDLIQACWEEDGYVTLTPERIQTCDPNYLFDIRWNKDRLPLAVSVIDAESNLLPEDSDEYRETAFAVREINLQFRFEMFRMGQEEDVRVWWGAPIRSHVRTAGGYCEFRGSNGTVESATIGIGSMFSVGTTHQILLHELGHVAGLSHNRDDSGSIMYPVQRADVMGEVYYPFRRFTDADITPLRMLYN